MRILKFLHKPAKAVDQRIDAGETEQPPPRRLGRSDDRFADPRLKLLDDGMRAEITAGGGSAHRIADPKRRAPVEDHFGLGLGEPEPIGISKMAPTIVSMPLSPKSDVRRRRRLRV
jgi:hypothetical protein